MITRDEAIELARKTFTDQGMDPETVENAVGRMPEAVLGEIMRTGEVKVHIKFIDADELAAMVNALRGPDGHIPGCDGQHDHDVPDVGIVLADNPDSPDSIGEHALGNIHVMLKAMLTWLATNPGQLTRLKHWMEDREAEVGADVPGLAASMRMTPGMMAFIGKALVNPHPDCPLYRDEECDKMSVVDGQQYQPGVAVKIPAAFRKPRFTAGGDGTKDEGEPVIDPRVLGHPFSI